VIHRPKYNDRTLSCAQLHIFRVMIFNQQWAPWKQKIWHPDDLLHPPYGLCQISQNSHALILINFESFDMMIKHSTPLYNSNSFQMSIWLIFIDMLSLAWSALQLSSFGSGKSQKCVTGACTHVLQSYSSCFSARIPGLRRQPCFGFGLQTRFLLRRFQFGLDLMRPVSIQIFWLQNFGYDTKCGGLHFGLWLLFR